METAEFKIHCCIHFLSFKNSNGLTITGINTGVLKAIFLRRLAPPPNCSRQYSIANPLTLFFVEQRSQVHLGMPF